MTRRERLEAIISGNTPDRPAVKVWGAQPDQDCVHPAFIPVRDAAIRLTDLVIGGGLPFNMYCGANIDRCIETWVEPTGSPEWEDRVTLYHTPDGELREVFRASTCGKPGYEQEHLLKEPSDITKLLSLPYAPYPLSLDTFRQCEATLGDAGVVMLGIDEAMFALQRFIGSENFALWSLEADDLIMEAITVFQQRLIDHVTAAVDAGFHGLFGWVGPELCIPPLMSPQAFDRYVYDFDAPLIDLIHNTGGSVWVHCHGKMRPVIERFAAMGVDVLNPIEPPPMGDITLEEAFALVGTRMALEGNIETHDFMTGRQEDIRAQVHHALDVGADQRFILCPSSGYMENTNPTPAEIDNWLLYITESVSYAKQLAVAGCKK